MLKILITGAYSTGKSTLAESLGLTLREAGHAVALLPDVARDCPVPLNGEQTEAATLWLLTTQIAREIESAQSQIEILLCDRGVPDIRAHFEDVTTRASGDLVPLMKPFLDAWVARYDLILLSRIDPDLSIENDGLRVTDPAYRERLDLYAAAGLREHENVMELPLGLERRLSYAFEAIRLRLSSTAP